MANPVSKAPKQRVSGVILIDKPQGLTSQQVVSKVKYLFKSPLHDSKKAGHTGTLDPMATGLLPVCLGEATKFSHYQLDADKAYEATIKLGERTDTGDAEGQVIATQVVPAIDSAAIEQTIQQFMGAQTQVPPMYSALKKDGKKLYEYAREGIEIERPARPITIRDLQLEWLTADSLRLQVTCTKGTYVRVLGEDIAQALGTVGHLTSLRRTQVGHFTTANSISLADLEALSLAQRFEHLLAVDACVTGLATLQITPEQCERVQVGQRLNVREQFTPELVSYLEAAPILTEAVASIDNDALDNHATVDIDEDGVPTRDIRLINEEGGFVGLGTLSINGRLQPKKILAR